MKNCFYLIQLLLIAFVFVACGAGESPATEAAADMEKTEESVDPIMAEAAGEEIQYATATTTMEGYIARPAGDEKVPGIIVVHEWWGHNEYSRNRANQLADLGYVALAVDMYGDGQQADHPEEAGGFAGKVFSDMEEAKARFESALEVLRNDPRVDPDKLAAIGYCFGGSVVLSMANAGYDLDAVAAFHSGVTLPIQPEEGGVKAKILVANGAEDPMVGADAITAYKKAMADAGAELEYVSYPGVVHGFTNPEATANGEKFKLPLAYDRAADEDSWAKMKALFAEVF